MIPLMVAAIGGGLATALVVAPFGAALAVLAAPFGGSLCAGLAAVYVARQRGHERQRHIDLDQQADAMVASLRSIAAQAKEDVKPPSRYQNEVTAGTTGRVG